MKRRAIAILKFIVAAATWGPIWLPQPLPRKAKP